MRYSFGDCVLDDETLALQRAGTKVAIQPKVFALLLLLVRERQRVLTRRELLDALWADVVVSDGAVAYTILELRKAIGDDTQSMVRTVRGFGFRFEAAVTVTAAAPAAKEEAKEEAKPAPSRALFVGRDSELAALTTCLADARRDQGRLAWISGEAGIGKTRLLDEILAHAKADGAVVMTGRSYEEEAPPFWVWTRIAESITGNRELALATKALCVDEGPERLRSFEQFTKRLVHAGSAGAFSGSSAGSGAGEQPVRAARAPLVFAFDDVQWLDPASLALLLFFVRETRHAPVLVVATHRDTATVHRARATLLAELLRAAEGRAFALRGLARADVAALVRARLQRDASPDFVEAVLGRTGGNPLLVEQLLGTAWAAKAAEEHVYAVASTTELRDDFSSSIARHVDAVSAECREVLTVAALLGRDFDLTTLLAASASRGPEVLDRVDEALRARLLQKSRDGALRFTHALVSEVLTKRLSGAARAERHAQIGRALMAHYGEPLDRHAAELAPHFLRAAPTGTAPQALDLARRAARHASNVGDLAGATRNLELALRALEFIPESDATRRDVLAQLEAIGSEPEKA